MLLDRVLCTILETLCLTNFRCTGLQFRGVGPIWLIRELPCKNFNVEEILSKVIIISCDYLLVSKMPKKHRKSEENRLFKKTRIQTILDKRPWDSTAIFIFFCYFSVSSLNSSAFSKFSCSSPSLHLIQSWNSKKNSGYTRPTLFVGWGEGLDLCELENAPEMQKCPKTFVHECRHNCGICALFVVSAPVKLCI